MSAPAAALLPYEPAQFEGLPPDLPVHVWDGAAPPPPQEILDTVGFFTVPYLGTAAALPLLPRMPALRVVQTLTAGVDDVLPYLPAGAVLCNARGVHDASTAELALALILASLRDIPGFVRGQDAEQWRSGFYPALADRTVLVVGYGSIGTAIEDRLTPFECRVRRVARTARQTPRGPVHPLSALPDLLPEADVVVLVVPQTEQSRGLVGTEFLSRMRDGALLVNVGRGPVVDTAALLAELESGRLRAALDVTDPEPLPPGHPLWHAPGVLISPHVGGSSSAFLPRALRLVSAQLRRYAAGELPDHQVHHRPEQGV
ncbi:2-hydroxyacid dehydrogenase [Peterkaempfera bronchialis]|uniref:Dihydrofolate reductase n=1 Tax=Peterkaempfera bronchialis TaxID=2126346 RepID=A0A345T0Q5_9ACTN|nr:2-hydroxyacid dehydrogenase [Peterkaempfera bronchialis]AXI79560.1 dihydrofolate reductase [Peterkaempfera bronchialis]